MEALGLKACLLTGSSKDRPLDKIASGGIDIVVGTHALIQEGVVFKNLGLAVVDEQHRFGVMQRALLKKKAVNPDVLVMTATPIPRTLALTLYGDLDYSVIDELPPNRQPLKTLLVSPQQKDAIYGMIREEVGKGRQVYVVYPVIEESEKADLRSAVIGKEAFEKVFPEFRIGLIHGRMKPLEREEIMASFKAGRDRYPGQHNSDRSRRGCPKCNAYDYNTCREVRSLAAPPVEGKNRERIARFLLCPARIQTLSARKRGEDLL